VDTGDPRASPAIAPVFGTVVSVLVTNGLPDANGGTGVLEPDAGWTGPKFHAFAFAITPIRSIARNPVRAAPVPIAITSAGATCVRWIRAERIAAGSAGWSYKASAVFEDAGPDPPAQRSAAQR